MKPAPCPQGLIGASVARMSGGGGGQALSPPQPRSGKSLQRPGEADVSLPDHRLCAQLLAWCFACTRVLLFHSHCCSYRWDVLLHFNGCKSFWEPLKNQEGREERMGRQKDRHSQAQAQSQVDGTKQSPPRTLQCDLPGTGSLQVLRDRPLLLIFPVLHPHQILVKTRIRCQSPGAAAAVVVVVT